MRRMFYGDSLPIRGFTKDGPSDLAEGSPYTHVASYPVGNGDSFVTAQDFGQFHVYKVSKAALQGNRDIGTHSMPSIGNKGGTSDQGEEGVMAEVEQRLDRIEQAIVILAQSEEAEGEYGEGEQNEFNEPEEDAGEAEEAARSGQGRTTGQDPFKLEVMSKSRSGKFMKDCRAVVA